MMSSKMVNISVPESLEMAITKIRASLELDFDQACEHLTALADPNGEKFQKAVNSEANRRYKSRHLVELNKSKKSFIDSGYKKGTREGRLSGAEEATKKWRVSYPCSVCDGPLYMKPEFTDWSKTIAEYLASQGWKHTTCR